ncbi:hypothetical protein K439DRAFT_1658555 [Ramaria rubella]|nr:hypothetical protein K439DRAFT_1658555 [Ramaria rubella]
MDIETSEDELVLRAHIRKLLLRYSLTHLTTNYVTYTRSEVSELLSEGLRCVPADDPLSLALPEEPFETLCRQLKLKQQQPYDQLWETNSASRQLLTEVLLERSNVREPPLRRCWDTDDETPFYNPYRPITPILTTRAIRQTPRLGASSPNKSLKQFDLKYLEHTNLKLAPDESLEEKEISPRERDGLLGFRSTLDKETLQALTSLFACVPGAQPRPIPTNDSFHIASMLSDYLHDGDSHPLVTPWRPMSPPIFPQQVGVTRAPGLEKSSDLPVLGFGIKVKVEDEEQDMAKEHMLLIDGWSQYLTLPNVMAPPPTSQSNTSNTPSLDSGSQSSHVEVDELFALTPPREPHLGMFSIEKMDECLIPRSRKPGGGRKKAIFSEPEQSLSSFLPALLPPVLEYIESEPQVTLHGSPPISLSILGQPPSPSKSISIAHDNAQNAVPHPAENEGHHTLDTGLDALIAKLCVPVSGQSPAELIMRERISDKETLMMDVPVLKEPHLHTKSQFCPTMPNSVRSLIATKNLTQNLEPSTAYLTKAVGLQSLNIELSWRPFNFGTSIPKTEELADVETFPGLDVPPKCDDNTVPELHMLLEGLESVDSGSEDRFRVDDLAVDCRAPLGEDSSLYDAILTRAERRRLAGQGKILSDESDAERSADEPMLEGVFEVQILSPQKRQKVDVPSRSPQPDPQLRVDLSKGAEEYAAGGSFSFQALCSPEASQTCSQDAPFWNAEGPGVVQLGAQAFLEQHTDPLETGVWASDLEKSHLSCLVDRSRVTQTYLQETDLQEIASSDPRYLLVNRSTRLESPLSSQASQDPIFVQQGRSHTQCHELTPGPHVETHAAPSIISDPFQVTSGARRSEKVSAQEELSNFMRMRGKTLRESNDVPSPKPSPMAALIVRPPSPPRGVPTELIDTNTLSLPDNWRAPPSRHRYIASLDIIQKTVLVNHLTSLDCNIDLIERDTFSTTGADLILDVDTAVLFVPLAPLSVNSEILADRIATLSWDFSRLVIVFEAFPSSLTYRRDNSSTPALTPYAFSPAIVKALRNFKRTLAILEGVQSAAGNLKRCGVEVRYAYARNVRDAALFARMVGEMCCVRGGEDREWLTDDYQEDEMDLARVRGMNAFAAAMILRCADINIDTLVEMKPARRFAMLAPMVGEERIIALNEEIASRLAQVAVSSSSLPVSPAGESTILPVTPDRESFKFEDNSYFRRGVHEDVYEGHPSRTHPDERMADY